MMRPSIALLVLAAVAVGGEEAAPHSTPFAWLQLQGNAAHDNYRPRTDEVVWPKVLWHVPGATGQPTLDGETLYSGGDALLAIDLRSGKTTAKVEAGFGVLFMEAPVIAGRIVVARRWDGRVFGFTRDLGKVVWEHRDAKATGPDWRATGAWDAGLYLFAARHRVRALDSRTGALRWSWENPRGARVRTVPASDGKRVYAGTDDGIFVALDLKSGREMWRFEQESGFGPGCPAVLEGRVVVTDRRTEEQPSGRVHCFDAKSGKVVWQFDANGLSSPGHEPGGILLGTGSKLLRISIKTARDQSIPTGRNPKGSPTRVGGTLYFGNLDGNLYAYDARSKELRWRFLVPGTFAPLGGGGRQFPNQVYDFVHDGKRIYVSTSGGLYCLAQDPEKRGKRPGGAVITP